MPSITGLTLTITGSPISTSIKLGVTYTATFTALERFLADNGLGFAELIQIIGDDPGDATDRVLHTFPAQSLVVPAGQSAITRSREITVPRGTLNEDPGPPSGGWPPKPPNADELLGRVEIRYVGLSSGPTRADSPVKTITVV